MHVIGRRHDANFPGAAAPNVPKSVAMTTSELLPGALVRHPTQPDWGLGQVQSVIGNRVTVNFEDAGKQLINADVVKLVPAD
jgi:hypothetical protein